MVEVSYTLQGEDGSREYQVRRSPMVPRVGEAIAFDLGRSYQVIDVLWHLDDDDDPRVTVTANELNWHKHIADAHTTWRRAHR